MATLEGSTSTSSSSSLLKRTGFSIFTVTILSGIGVAYRKFKRVNPAPFQNLNHEVSKFALKAFGYGTVLSIAGCGLLTVVVCKSLGVTTAKEFGLKMKDILPSKDGSFVHKFDNWPTKLVEKPDNDSWHDEFK